MKRLVFVFKKMSGKDFFEAFFCEMACGTRLKEEWEIIFVPSPLSPTTVNHFPQGESTVLVALITIITSFLQRGGYFFFLGKEHRRRKKTAGSSFASCVARLITSPYIVSRLCTDDTAFPQICCKKIFTFPQNNIKLKF